MCGGSSEGNNNHNNAFLKITRVINQPQEWQSGGLEKEFEHNYTNINNNYKKNITEKADTVQYSSTLVRYTTVQIYSRGCYTTV